MRHRLEAREDSRGRDGGVAVGTSSILRKVVGATVLGSGGECSPTEKRGDEDEMGGSVACAAATTTVDTNPKRKTEAVDKRQPKSGKAPNEIRQSSVKR